METLIDFSDIDFVNNLNNLYLCLENRERKKIRKKEKIKKG